MEVFIVNDALGRAYSRKDVIDSGVYDPKEMDFTHDYENDFGDYNNLKHSATAFSVSRKLRIESFIQDKPNAGLA